MTILPTTHSLYTLDAHDVTRPSTNRRPRRGRRPPPLAWADPPRGDPTWSPDAVTSSLLMTSARPTWTNQKPAKRAKVGTITTMVVFGQGDCIRSKWMHSGKSGFIRRKLVWYSGKVVVFGQSCCIRAKVVVFGQKWLYSSQMVVFGQKSLYSGKMVLFGQKWLYSGKLVVSGQNWYYLRKGDCIRKKVVVFGQKWLYSGKVVVLGQKWL